MTPALGTSRRRLAVLLLVCVAVALTGCAGWGTDGPADGPNASNPSSDDLEDGQGNDSSNADSDGSGATNASDSTASGEESDDGTPDGGEDDGATDTGSETGETADESDPSDGDSGSAESNDESGDEDASDGSEGGSEESTDEDTENEPDGADDGETDDGETDTGENPGDASPSEQPPADENGDENASDENTTDGNASNDPETYTLTVEAEGPVTIERLSDGATTTREATDGTVEFTVLEDDYEIRAGAEEYVDPMLSFGIDEDTTVTLQRDGSITYTVVDAETGEPIEGAEISGMCDLWYSSGDAYITGESNASGVIEAETLTPTTCRYDTQITAEGYESTSLGEIDVPEDDGTTVELQPEGSESPAAFAHGGFDDTASIART